MPTITTAEYWTTVRREPFIVGYWRGNDVSGDAQASDSAARYGLPGIYVDDQSLGPALIKADDAAGSTVVDSSGGFYVPDTDVLEITGDITLEAVVAPYSTGQSAQIIGKLDSDATYASPYALRLSDGELQFALGDGSSEVTLTYGTALPASIPSLVQGVCFRGVMSLFVDGTAVTTGVLDSQTVADGGQQVRVGSASDDSTQFSGLIGEVAVYDGALSARRVARHFSLAQQIYPDAAHYLGVDPPKLVV